MIQFILNNQKVSTEANSGTTLLDFIRTHKQLKGTKIGCREGDCGACTVLVGTLEDDAVNYKSITSCISPLGNVQGKHIVTVEGINLPKSLNTVQKAMVDNYATQCGFCTPGFVVSMTGYALDNTKSESCNDAISGNICRCTGYKSIEKAGFEIEEKLALKNDNDTINWLVQEGFIPNYFETIPTRLKELILSSSSESSNTNGTKVANGTDLYVRYADLLANKEMNLLAKRDDLYQVEFNKDVCTLGANTTVSDIANSKKLQTLFPKLKQFLKLVSSEQIRNMGTLGGNFVNASPIGDMSIFFLALNTELTILKEDKSERKLAFKDFHTDYKKFDLQEDEVIKSLSFKIPQGNDFFNFEKVSKRTHLDIASVNAAARISSENNNITEAHFAVGGVAAVPKYLQKTSRFLEGKEISEENIKEAEAILQSEISPISDVRGTSDYKRLLAKQLFFAHFIELFPTLIQPKNLMN